MRKDVGHVRANLTKAMPHASVSNQCPLSGKPLRQSRLRGGADRRYLAADDIFVLVPRARARYAPPLSATVVWLRYRLSWLVLLDDAVLTRLAALLRPNSIFNEVKESRPKPSWNTSDVAVEVSFFVGTNRQQ